MNTDEPLVEAPLFVKRSQKGAIHGDSWLIWRHQTGDGHLTSGVKAAGGGAKGLADMKPV